MIFHPFVAILGVMATNLVAIIRVMTTRRVANNGDALHNLAISNDLLGGSYYKTKTSVTL